MALTRVPNDQPAFPAGPASQSTSHDPDLVLVQRVVQWRDEAAFLRLYRRHTPVMERVLRASGIRDEDQLDDLIQESWLRAARRLAVFAGRSTLRTWLVGITINVRREAHRAPSTVPLPLSAAGHVAAPAAMLDDDRLLHDTLAALPPPLRQVFELRAIDGLSHEEIAHRLQLTPGNVRIRYHRARRMLRERFTGDSTTGAEHA